MTIHAQNKAAAISSARKRVWLECHYLRGDGVLVYTATEMKEV